MPTVVPNLNIVGTTATVSGSEAGSINVFVFTLQGQNNWHSLASIVGDGAIDLSPLPGGDYTGRIMSIGSPGTVSEAVNFNIAATALGTGINANWGRWLYASICQYFDTHRGTLDMFLEGEHRATSQLQKFFELRVDGPYYQNLNKGWWNLTVEVNAIITVAKSDQDFHEIRRATDFVASLFSNTIHCYRYGDGPYDDSSFIGCLTALDGYRRQLQISHFGQLHPTDAVLQACVERHYKMVLPEE